MREKCIRHKSFQLIIATTLPVEIYTGQKEPKYTVNISINAWTKILNKPVVCASNTGMRVDIKGKILTYNSLGHI